MRSIKYLGNYGEKLTLKKVQKIVKFACWQPIKDRIKLFLLKESFSKRFPNSYVMPENIFPAEVVESIGVESYGFFKAIFFDDIKECKLKIGAYCSIGQETTFVLGGEHQIDRMSTYPFDKRIINRKIPESRRKGNIVIEDDVWIGYGATIMSGVHIGQGAIIGAKSIITKDVPPYAVCVGAGKIVKYRFDSEIIENLLKIDYSRLREEDILINQKLLSEKIDFNWFENNELYIKLSGGNK